MMTLSPEQTRALKAFAGAMIPASSKYGVPGADDDLIFADMTRGLSRDLDELVAALSRLEVLAGGRYADLPATRRLEIANAFRAEGGAAFATLTRVVLLAYYRDDRVMRSLGQEPRPPFPEGHVVEQGDWSLLAPVKARKPFYRKAG